MGKTILLKTEVEEYVRGFLAKKFGQAFTSQRLTLKSGRKKEFDAVSEDREIVFDVKTHRGTTRGGRSPTGGLKSSTAELYFLSLAKGRVRGLALTDATFKQQLESYLGGSDPSGIVIEFIPLPRDLAARVAIVRAEASREQRSRDDPR